MRMFLRDVSSLAAMVETATIGRVDVCEKTRTRFEQVVARSQKELTSRLMLRVPLAEGNELKDTLKNAVHDSNLKSPRRKKGVHA